MAASGKRAKTKINTVIQRPTAMGVKSQEVSLAYENGYGNVLQTQELVPDPGEVRQSPDRLAVQARKQPTYPM